MKIHLQCTALFINNVDVGIQKNTRRQLMGILPINKEVTARSKGKMQITKSPGF